MPAPAPSAPPSKAPVSGEPTRAPPSRPAPAPIPAPLSALSPVVWPQAPRPSSGTANAAINIRFNQPSIGYRSSGYGAVCDALRPNRAEFMEVEPHADPPVRELPRAVLRTF